MVTGATGFIGSKLLSGLVSKGYKVKGMSRKKLSDIPNIKYEETDVFNLEKLTKSLEGIEVAYYLLHSMEGSKEHWKDFALRERIQAQNFLKAATRITSYNVCYTKLLRDITAQ